jgi:hypothetical protein
VIFYCRYSSIVTLSKIDTSMSPFQNSNKTMSNVREEVKQNPAFMNENEENLNFDN